MHTCEHTASRLSHHREPRALRATELAARERAASGAAPPRRRRRANRDSRIERSVLNSVRRAMASFGSKRQGPLATQGGGVKRQTPASLKSGSRFSPAGSRLAACPLCNKHVHVLLLTEHVEGHFTGGEEQRAPPPLHLTDGAAEPTKPLLALMDRPHQDEQCEPDAAGSAGVSAGVSEGALDGGAAQGGRAGGAREGDENTPPASTLWNVMSGDATCCGLCTEPFDEARRRFLFWPCQHLRQCGECALRVWSQPKARRRCPWCSGKLEVRPKAFKPWL